VVDLEALRHNISSTLGRGKMVLDGHYAHELTNPDTTRLVFVLRRAPWVLLEELRGRGYNENKVWENVDAEILASCLSEALERFPSDKVCELDTTGASPSETLTTGLASLERGSCSDVYTDWMNREETVSILRERPCI
jgi:adenylate kinase